jgi:hypothetical protein
MFVLYLEVEFLSSDDDDRFVPLGPGDYEGLEGLRLARWIGRSRIAAGM